MAQPLHSGHIGTFDKILTDGPEADGALTLKEEEEDLIKEVNISSPSSSQIPTNFTYIHFLLYIILSIALGHQRKIQVSAQIQTHQGPIRERLCQTIEIYCALILQSCNQHNSI